jgi:hypothetical protein
MVVPVSDMDQNDSDSKGGHGRPLGRGLEDVSHLFLSHKLPTPTGAPVLAPEPESSVPPAHPRHAVPLRPVQVTRDRLADILPLDWSGALEEGLRTIDAKVPCHPCGEIDVLAVDRAGKLTIIDVDTTCNDGLLLRGLGHVDWIVRNAPGVQRMCPVHGVDFSLSPRLILLAPQFSPQLRRAMRQLTRPQIQWVRYHAVETPAGLGILFEPITGE